MYWMNPSIAFITTCRCPVAFSRMDSDSKTRLDIQTVLNDAINLLDMRTPCSPAFYASVEKAQAYLEENLYQRWAAMPT